MKAPYLYEFPDYLEAGRLNSQKRFGLFSFRSWLPMSMIGIGLLSWANSFPVAFPSLALIAIGFYLLIYATWTAHTAFDRGWAEMKRMFPAELEFDEIGLRVQFTKGAFDYRWDCFTRCRETRGIFALYVNNRVTFVVPKRGMDVGALRYFREITQRHFGEKLFAFPVSVAPPSAPADDAKPLS